MIAVPDTNQIREADRFTIQHEPISSINLLQRATQKLFVALKPERKKFKHFIIFCGPGNNGGDGLTIAKHLLTEKKSVSVYVLQCHKYSAEFLQCLHELEYQQQQIHFIKSKKDFPTIASNDCVIDALFGSGLSKPLSGIAAQLVQHINKNSSPTVCIDIPSGMHADVLMKSPCIHAHRTLSIQFPKLSFFIPDSGQHVGEFQIVNIGLLKNAIAQNDWKHFLIEAADVKKILHPRNKFDHKGKFGHALLVAGSHGMYGAATLAALACMRSGAGKTTLFTDDLFAKEISVAHPECMTNTSSFSNLLSVINQNYTAVGVGPGLGGRMKKEIDLQKLFATTKIPLLLDADALNELSRNKKLLYHIPANSILTPHVGEFDRLFGTSANGFIRHEKQISASKKFNCIIVLKGAYTCISTPDGKCYFNSTGNAGLAKGGSGDVLSGIITSLLAQHYSTLHSAIAGVYLHGLAADLATKKIHINSLLATDVVNNISNAFKRVMKNESN